MTEQTHAEKAQALRANILADTITRAVQWLLFLGIVLGMVAPLAWAALRNAGVAAALVVLALGVACAWHVKPHGRSAAAQCAEIEARFKPHD